VVTFEEGENLAKEYNVSFFETSAINDINVDEAFMRITKDVSARIQSGGGSSSSSSSKAIKPGASGSRTISSFSSSDPKPKRSWC
jgi:hypothetical protein